MAEVTMTPAHFRKCDSAKGLAEKLIEPLTQLRHLIGTNQAYQEEAARVVHSHTAAADLSRAKLALERCHLRVAVEKATSRVEAFNAQWKELRAELDMSHVLAVSPE